MEASMLVNGKMANDIVLKRHYGPDQMIHNMKEHGTMISNTGMEHRIIQMVCNVSHSYAHLVVYSFTTFYLYLNLLLLILYSIFYDTVTGAKYIGEFARGCEHGHGVQTFPDGSKFEGRFRFGRRDGPGNVESRF